MLLKTIIILGNCWILVTQMNVIMDVLNQDAIAMALWDPTQIIAAPFPEDVLRDFVFRSFASGMITSTILFMVETQLLSTKLTDMNSIDAISVILVNVPRYVVSSTLLQLFLAVVILFLSILMGAPLWVWLQHTALASLYVSSLAFGFIQSKSSIGDKLKVGNEIIHAIKSFLHPIVYTMTGPTKISPSIGDAKVSASKNVPKGVSNSGHGDWTSFDEMNRCILYSTFVITIPFMILNVLDHGDQKQRWPVPILIGSTVGHVVGVGVGIISVWVSPAVQNVRYRMREKSRVA